eukprot:scaffold6937_cov376-Prasinococcus_capsulatus_cf.AAC.1
MSEPAVGGPPYCPAPAGRPAPRSPRARALSLARSLSLSRAPLSGPARPPRRPAAAGGGLPLKLNAWAAAHSWARPRGAVDLAAGRPPGK